MCGVVKCVSATCRITIKVLEYLLTRGNIAQHHEVIKVPKYHVTLSDRIWKLGWQLDPITDTLVASM